MKRCFVALGITQAARAALLELQAELARVRLGSREKLKLTRPESLHLTIKFLGATADAQLGDLVAALELVAAESRPPEAELLGVGAFPSPARPRAIFAAVGPGRERVVALAAAVDSAAFELGFAREERARVPHLTIARVEEARPRGRLTDFIERQQAAPQPFGPVDASGLVLYESTLQPGGSLYTAIATLPFRR